MRNSGEERRQLILARARESGHVEVSKLATQLQVSPETVRRDLQTLEEHGLVRRNHGGAYPAENGGYESSIQMRSSSRVAEKKRIAAAATSFLGDAETLFLDEGYTPHLVAEELVSHHRPLTVVTASLQNASLLATQSHHSVVIVGGRVRERTLATVDHWALSMISQFNFAVAIVGANGITRDHGLTTPDPAVAAVKAAAIQASRRRIFVGVHTKFGVTSFCRFAQVSDFELIVTEAALPQREALLYSALGPRVIRA